MGGKGNGGGTVLPDTLDSSTYLTIHLVKFKSDLFAPLCAGIAQAYTKHY